MYDSFIVVYSISNKQIREVSDTNNPDHRLTQIKKDIQAEKYCWNKFKDCPPGDIAYVIIGGPQDGRSGVLN